ncbi:MAG: hypothetical protein ACK4KW_06205 [Gemmobacter sp.]
MWHAYVAEIPAGWRALRPACSQRRPRLVDQVRQILSLSQIKGFKGFGPEFFCVVREQMREQRCKNILPVSGRKRPT